MMNLHVFVPVRSCGRMCASVFLVIACLIVPDLIHAAEETISPAPESTRPDMVRVATVNVQDAEVTQRGNDFTITFSISNRIGAQPGIGYGVLLVKNDENGQVIIDHAVSDKFFTLGPGERVVRTILYTAPPVPPGSYSLVLASENQYGFPFGMNYLGDFDITQHGDGIFVDERRCSLMVGKDTDQYPLGAGVDVGEGEEMVLTCMVANLSDEERTFTPSLVTQTRSFFGDRAETAPLGDASYTFMPREERSISFVLPKALQPQSYSAVVRMGERGNAVVARYVVRGGSGTLQNVVFDKSSYESGETAQMNVFWTRSADSFTGSRDGIGTTVLEPQLTIMLTDSTGVPCGEPFTHTLSSEVEKVFMPISRTCASFSALFTLSHADFGELGNVTYRIPVPASSDKRFIAYVQEEGRAVVLILASLIALGAMLVLAYYLYRYGRRAPASLRMMLALLLFGFLAHAPSAHADSFWAYIDEYPDPNGIYRAVLYTVNLDKSVYAPGEMMRLTGSGNIQGECNNPCIYFYGAECRARGLWAAELDGIPISPVYIIPLVEGEAAGLNAGVTFFGSATLRAPNEVGPHTVFVEGTAAPAGIANQSYGVLLPFTVEAATPPHNATVPTLNNPTHSGVTETSAVIGATIVADGGSAITERGTCWGSLPNPRTNCSPEGGVALGAFSHIRDSLPSRSTIYYSGYAKNAVGTGYSSSNAFDTQVIPTVSLALCTLGGTACVSNGGTKYIYEGEEVEATWTSSDAISCSRIEGPSDFDVSKTQDTDTTLTEPTFGNTQVFRIECTNGIPREAMVTLITNGEPRCTPQVIDGCRVPDDLEDGESGGVCDAGQSGLCTYTCDADDDRWVRNTNQCVTPAILSFVICDKGKNDGSCVTDKSVPPGTEVTVRWTSEHTNSCEETNNRFDTGMSTNGSVNVIASALTNNVTNYQLMCEQGGTPTFPKTATLRTGTNLPDLTASQIRVPIGANIRLSWDTRNGNETLCTLSGGGLVSQDVLGNGTGIPGRENETGWADVRISGRTIFTLSCGGMVDTVTVEVIPGVWEE